VERCGLEATRGPPFIGPRGVWEGCIEAVGEIRRWPAIMARWSLDAAVPGGKGARRRECATTH
jgi:hypothetical protein